MPSTGIDSIWSPVQANDTLSDSAAFRFADPASTDIYIRDEAGEPPAPLFSGHALATPRIQPESRPPGNPDWFIIMLVAVIAYFTTIRVLYERVLGQLLNAFTSNTVSSQAVRDENLLMQRTSVFLSVLFYFSGGLFLYKLALFFHWRTDPFGTGFQLFFLFVVLLASIYAIKLILLKLLGVIFLAGKLVSSYIFNVFLINNVIGIILLPAVIGIAFLPPAYQPAIIYTGLGIIGLFWLYRILRGIRAWTSMHGHSVYYLILYLCAFEIAPLFVIFKLI